MAFSARRSAAWLIAATSRGSASTAARAASAMARARAGSSAGWLRAHPDGLVLSSAGPELADRRTVRPNGLSTLRAPPAVAESGPQPAESASSRPPSDRMRRIWGESRLPATLPSLLPAAPGRPSLAAPPSVGGSPVTGTTGAPVTFASSAEGPAGPTRLRVCARTLTADAE